MTSHHPTGDRCRLASARLASARLANLTARPPSPPPANLTAGQRPRRPAPTGAPHLSPAPHPADWSSVRLPRS